MSKPFTPHTDYLPLDRNPEPPPQLDAFEEHWRNQATLQRENAGRQRRDYNPLARRQP